MVWPASEGGFKSNFPSIQTRFWGPSTSKDVFEKIRRVLLEWAREVAVLAGVTKYLMGTYGTYGCRDFFGIYGSSEGTSDLLNLS